MLAWKIAPALAVRQHRRAQAGGDDAADRAAVRRDLPAGRPAAGRRQHRHRRRRRPGRRWSSTPTSTRSRSPARPRSARRSPGPSPAPASGSRSSSAARPPTSSSTTRRSTRRSRASSTGSSSTRATSAARARGCWSRSRRRRGARPAQAPDGDPARSATRWTRTPTSAPSTPPSSSSGSATLSDIGEAEGADRWSPPCELPDRGFWFAPTVFTERHPVAPDRPRGDLRPGAVGADVPHAGRGGRQGQQHAVRPVGRRLDREGLADPVDGDRLRAGVVWANTFNQFDPASPFGGYKESGLRPRGRPARAGGATCR